MDLVLQEKVTLSKGEGGQSNKEGILEKIASRSKTPSLF
jgi:hypothetical protein